MSNDAMTHLRAAPLFSTCSNEDLSIISSLCESRKIEDNGVVFSTGDPADRFYVVQSGEVAIRKSDEEGSWRDIARFREGDCIGELDFFVSGNRNADAMAAGDVVLLEFPGGGRCLKDVIDAHPSVTARLYRAFLIGISARIRGANSLVKENSPLVQELRRQVYEDKLTGLNNRTRFQEVLNQQLKECTPTAPVGLLMFKPDNFKTFNDSFGHEVGDQLLKHMARVLKGLELDKDQIFRYTGNENAVIFSNTSQEELLQWSQIIGDTMRSLDFSGIIPSTSLRLSMSFGMVLAPVHGTNQEDLVETAHELVMQGRKLGGNHAFFPKEAS
ncbi:MAG: GGDEF domain-containing protein [Spirochaetales bacterium]|nr:GGDEF domain-containing protein [Spirochaetales bacterium]